MRALLGDAAGADAGGTDRTIPWGVDVGLGASSGAMLCLAVVHAALGAS